jgi:hypothetical protein
MKSMFDIDIMRGLDEDSRFVNLMMHRRHLFEHNAGPADERYVRLSGDPNAQEGVLIRETQANAQEGVLIRETQANAHRLIGGLTRMAENLDADFHQIFPPTEWPINHHREAQERRRRPAD